MDIAIIILNWNNPNLTISAVKSLQWTEDIDVKIIVADNGSTDDSYHRFKLIRGIDILRLKCNYGYAGGNNRAVKYAIEKYNPEYILLLNNDAELEENALNILYNNRSKADILSPKIYYEDGKTLWACGGMVNLWESLAINRGEGETDYKQYEKVEEIDFANGCALWINTKVIKKIDLFDESYFCYYEDVDFSMRARVCGFPIMYLPEAIVYHKSGYTSGSNKKAIYRSAFADLLTLRNRILFTNKHLRNRLLSVYLFILISFLLRLIRKQKKRAYLILNLMWFGLKANNMVILKFPVKYFLSFKD